MKHYTLSVLGMSSVKRKPLQEKMAQLKRCGADLVLVCFAFLCLDFSCAEHFLIQVKEIVKFFKEQGYELEILFAISLNE